MLTCPKCEKDMHPVCSNLNCKCRTGIPVGELPMNNFSTVFGVRVSVKTGQRLWHAVWGINNVFNIIIDPSRFIGEFEECPYCGFSQTMDYWEDRNMEQTFPNGVTK